MKGQEDKIMVEKVPKQVRSKQHIEKEFIQLKVLCYNARSVFQKGNYFALISLLETEDYDIILINETWLRKELSLRTSKYSIYQFNSPNKG